MHLSTSCLIKQGVLQQHFGKGGGGVIGQGAFPKKLTLLWRGTVSLFIYLLGLDAMSPGKVLFILITKLITPLSGSLQSIYHLCWVYK